MDYTHLNERLRSVPPENHYAPMVVRGVTPEPYSHHHHHHHEHGEDHSRQRRHSFSSAVRHNSEPILDKALHLSVPGVVHVRHSHSHHHGRSHSHGQHHHSHPHSSGQNHNQQYIPSGHIRSPLPSHPAYHPQFQYSKCTGRKKALCIGINYIGQPNELRGCINDAEHVREFLIKQYHFRSQDIVVLADNRTNPRQQPTRKNMIDAMYWLVKDAQPNDSLFFQYSGHGGQTQDLDGDEIDGMDEVIYPVDFRKRGHIVDDEMHRIMVKNLPPGCRLTALFDSCHSGTVLDLPFIYSSHGRLKGNMVSPRARNRLASPADVISFSACKDGQKSVDTFRGGVAVGAMSYAFIKSLKGNPNQSYQALLKDVREILYPKYTQKPQLGSSHQVDTSLKFVL
ncbi:hypothetical protein K435DRAFT_7433 [Dendrothele bispora CBS 962.96]|uniref:Peptidase C14 caspase domain-containing protein n=1 Tax=Dendrothele bispora (strain CBS 962.96) TaxID=1314807 RepID=A0A4S8MY34_DENBC|nr:hypothetical protein K435DRAFT_7433 [Dendrothele bispora CBS 962.96]